MRKSTSLLLILTLMFVTMGDDCGSNSGIPNPGFRLLCIRKVGSSEDAIRGARTDGTLRARADNATGIRENFFVESGSSGQADVPNGVAPAFWRLDAFDGWNECNGRSAFV